MIQYREIHDFWPQQLEGLFRSVEWQSANYPRQLVEAMRGASTVISAWDGEQLVGLVNALDDGVLTAYVHYLLVHPDYQGQGIGSELLAHIKKKYKDYLYLILISEDEKKVPFYIKNGLGQPKEAVPMMILKKGFEISGEGRIV